MYKRQDLGYCVRQQKNVPRGERYELCRSVHAEANAIISAPRDEMIGATLYLCGRDVETGQYVENATSCSMCQRLIINAGISTVIARLDDQGRYAVCDVQSDWVDQEDLEKFGY